MLRRGRGGGTTYRPSAIMTVMWLTDARFKKIQNLVMCILEFYYIIDQGQLLLALPLLHASTLSHVLQDVVHV